MSESFSKHFIDLEIHREFKSANLGATTTEELELLIESETELHKQNLEELGEEIDAILELEGETLESKFYTEKDSLLLHWVSVKEESAKTSLQLVDQLRRARSWETAGEGFANIKEDLIHELVTALSSSPPGFSLSETPTQWRDKRLTELSKEKNNLVDAHSKFLVKAKKYLDWAVQLEKETNFL